MQAPVFVLRRRGRRLKERGGEGAAGTLAMSSCTHGTEIHSTATLTIQDVRGSNTTDVIPPLHEPVMVAIGQESFLLRGYEAEDGAGYVQEWMCVVVS